jgi:hypothetical protein
MRFQASGNTGGLTVERDGVSSHDGIGEVGPDFILIT